MWTLSIIIYMGRSIKWGVPFGDDRWKQLTAEKLKL